MTRMKIAFNVWNAIKSYEDSGYSVEWVKKNPRMWEIVSQVLVWREKVDKGEIDISDIFS